MKITHFKTIWQIFFVCLFSAIVICFTSPVLYVSAEDEVVLGGFITLRGEITCSDTGNAPSSTKISVYDENTTNLIHEEVIHDGVYELNLESGVYCVYYAANGYTTKISDGITISREKVYVNDVVLQKSSTSVTSSMGTLHIIVKDPTGNPIPDADVQIWERTGVGLEYYNGALVRFGFFIDAQAPCQELKTDTNGEFEIPIDPSFPNEYVVMVDKDDYRGAANVIRTEKYDISEKKDHYLELSLIPHYSNLYRMGMRVQVEDGDTIDDVTVTLYKGWKNIALTDAYAIADTLIGEYSYIGWSVVDGGRYTAEIKKEGYKTLYLDMYANTTMSYLVTLEKDSKYPATGTATESVDPQIEDLITRLRNASSEDDFCKDFYIHIDPTEQLSLEGTNNEGHFEIYISDRYDDGYGCIPPSYRKHSDLSICIDKSPAYTGDIYSRLELSFNKTLSSYHLETTEKKYVDGVLTDNSRFYDIYPYDFWISDSHYIGSTYRTNIPVFETLELTWGYTDLMRTYWSDRNESNLTAIRDYLVANATFDKQ